MFNLEDLDMVTDRTACTYRQAKEALEKTNGNVLEAIILIEEAYLDAELEEKSHGFSKIYKKLIEVLKEVNANRIVFHDKDKTILDIPISAGAVGLGFFFNTTIIALAAAFATGCQIKVYLKDGRVFDFKEYSEDIVDKIKAKFKNDSSQSKKHEVDCCSDSHNKEECLDGHKYDEKCCATDHTHTNDCCENSKVHSYDCGEKNHKHSSETCKDGHKYDDKCCPDEHTHSSDCCENSKVHSYDSDEKNHKHSSETCKDGHKYDEKCCPDEHIHSEKCCPEK